MNTRLSTSSTRIPELHVGLDGALYTQREGETLRVYPACCFPWSNQDEFISLRDSENREVYLVERLGDLSSASRGALASALASSRFAFRIERVHAIEENIEIRTWKVDTRQGLRSFHTELDHWPRPAPGGTHVIEDVAGDTFLLPPLTELDKKSQKLVWPFVD